MSPDAPGLEGERLVARLLDGRALATDMLAATSRDLEALRVKRGQAASIAVVMVGDDAASGVYARRILKTAQRVCAQGRIIELGSSTTRAELARVLRGLSRDPDTAGVILQLPLPASLGVRHVIEELDPLKDLDGVHPFNAGLISRGEIGFAPSCAEAALVMLRHYGIPLAGRPAVVVGRSNVVGRPVQQLLVGEDATVTICHRRTHDLASELSRAEVVVVAAGSARLVAGSVLRPGAVVIDCGINVLSDGTIVGDVDAPSVQAVASALTPVPGGVGPVTNAVLMDHLVRAVKAQDEGGFPDAQPREADE
jgi:methylenetetrahydrofolate dehydrogenase (NADP+)/methenyltetrahydrofolate cyclohydrolase